ncbi:MAG: hypothetical protein O3B43_04875 [Chloroflexi bacterium]|nr:hypothetical protein [Chloroflexota bacterium]
MMDKQKFVLGLITDLFFSPRLVSNARQMGYRTGLIESAQQYSEAEDFLRFLKTDAPDLIVIDLDSGLPWPKWLEHAKQDAQLKNIPWLAYGSHKDVKKLARAKRVGANMIVAKSKFTSEMPQLIEKLLG